MMKCPNCQTDIDNRGDCPWGCSQEPPAKEKADDRLALTAGSPSSDEPPTPHPSGAWDRSDFIRHTAQLEAALLEIAKQHLAAEMDEAISEHADWEGGYEAIVKVARAALCLPENTPAHPPR